jgi:hypothetical protein
LGALQRALSLEIEMSKPRIAQVLCPKRHCISAIAYQPDEQAGPTPQSICQQLQSHMDVAIQLRLFNPWCAICWAPRSSWFIDDQEMRFASLDEAREYLAYCEREQRAAAAFWKHSRG